MKFFEGMATICMSMFLAVPALAQSEGGEAGGGSDPQVFQAEMFKIVPPSGWLHVSGLLSDTELQKVPENVREHYTKTMSDVIFLDLRSPDSDTQNFKNSLNIVTVPEEISLTKELVKELTTVLEQQYASMFTDFTLDSSGVERVGEREVLMFKGHYTVREFSVNMEQVLVPSKSGSLVLTCTADSQKGGEAMEACRKSVASVTFTD